VNTPLFNNLNILFDLCLVAVYDTPHIVYSLAHIMTVTRQVVNALRANAISEADVLVDKVPTHSTKY
jgi:hypothetical protein